MVCDTEAGMAVAAASDIKIALNVMIRFGGRVAMIVAGCDTVGTVTVGGEVMDARADVVDDDEREVETEDAVRSGIAVLVFDADVALWWSPLLIATCRISSLTRSPCRW